MWLMLHSGSRNIGKTTAEYYNKIAWEQMVKLDPTLKSKKLSQDELYYMRIDS